MSSNAFRMQPAAMSESTEVLHAGDSLLGRRVMRQEDAGTLAAFKPKPIFAKENAYIVMQLQSGMVDLRVFPNCSSLPLN